MAACTLVFLVEIFREPIATPETVFPKSVKPQEAQALFARARLCLPYNKGRKETLRPK
jgi:hypothetical protein